MLVAGVGCFLLYIESRRASLLLLAGTGIGLAVTFRAVGLALLPGFLAGVASLGTGRAGCFRGSRLARCALAALPVVLLYAGAAGSQFVHHGRFGLGNWGGMDLLGKVPLLSHPVPNSSEFSRLNAIVEAMRPAREKLGQLPPLVEPLAARQY